jgi:outer membrane protein assembly factor BamA
LIPSLFLDHRDDPLNPSRGWLSGAQLQLASPALLGDAEYLKIQGQQAGYLSLGPFGTLAGSLRFGAIEPLGTVEGRESRSIPLDERLFAGGRTTHRAYSRLTLGTPGDTVVAVPEADGGSTLLPVGGNGMLLLNLDYRFPIAGSLGGTVFADAGNVWGDWRDVRLGELKTGAGIGLRFLSPIGPLRLDLAWKLDREPEEDPTQIFISFGNAF